MSANGFVGACNTKEKGEPRKYIYYTFVILGVQMQHTSRFHNPVCICLIYLVNKDIDISSDISHTHIL